METLSACPRTTTSGLKKFELLIICLSRDLDPDGSLKDLEKKDLSQTLNDLSMASPFSLEEKQILLESLDINVRKEKMEQILNNYIKDEFENTTLQ